MSPPIPCYHCGATWAEHVNGRCPDGGGRYTVPNPTLSITPEEILALVKAVSERRGYRIEVSEDGTEERLIRPDGSVAVIARKKPQAVQP